MIFNAYVKFEEAMLEHNEVDNNAYSDDDEEQDEDEEGSESEENLADQVNMLLDFTFRDVPEK